MKVAIYARVSTDDKGQDTDTQLYPLREWVETSGNTLYKEYVDHASALDFVRRKAWAELMDDAMHKRFDMLLVYHLDRAWRSILHAINGINQFNNMNIAFKSHTQELLDTSSPQGFLIVALYSYVAEVEVKDRSIKVKAGLDRARKQGKHIGRSGTPQKKGAKEKFLKAFKQLDSGASKKSVAQNSGIPRTTLTRAYSKYQKGNE